MILAILLTYAKIEVTLVGITLYAMWRDQPDTPVAGVVRR